MYLFIEIAFDDVAWPGIKGVRVFKDGNLQQLGGRVACKNMKEWAQVISQYYSEGLEFEPSRRTFKDSVIGEVARTGENILEDLEKEFPEFFV